MATVRFTDGNDTIILGSDATFLGLGGDDVYVFEPNVIPANAQIRVGDSQGDNTLRFPDGLEVVQSDVATLGNGGVSIRLTLSNGTTVAIDNAEGFDFEVGGDIAGNDAVPQTLTEFVEDTLGTTVPAPNETSQGGAVTVGSENTGPVATADSGSTDEDTTVTIDVLDNDSDPDGDLLQLVDAGDGANGTTEVNADDTVTYTPEAGFTGTDSFEYTVSDGDLTDTAQVTVTVEAAGGGGGGNDIPIDMAGDITGATAGVADRFVLRVDNGGVSGGNVVNGDFGGAATITGFDPAEDTLVFENAPGSTVIEADILNEIGVNVIENPFAVTLTYVLFPEDPAGDTPVVTLDGITEQNGDFIDVA